MTQRVAFDALLLLLGVLLVPCAEAQDPTEGIPVRPVRDVGTLERLGIAVRHALVPGSKVIAPLYAYNRGLACRETPLEQLGKHDGSAAIVAKQDKATVAFYYRTVDEAITAAKKDGWCEKDVTWHLATTYPLDSDIKEEERYLSQDVERIEARLRKN